jgi:hypothetical protein
VGPQGPRLRERLHRACPASRFSRDYFLLSILLFCSLLNGSQAAAAAVARMEGMLIDCVAEVRRDLVNVSAGTPHLSFVHISTSV